MGLPVVRHEQLPAPVKEPNQMPLGTAAWGNGNRSSLQPYAPGQFWLGFDGEQHVGLADDQHVFICGGTRGGKGVSLLVPNLCLWPGSAVVIDPKGENAILTAHRRALGSRYAEGLGQKVRILDPFNVVELAGEDFSSLKGAYNPLDALHADHEESIDEAARIAEALVVSESSAEPFWNESARDLLQAVILHVATWRDFLGDERNLVTVRRLIAAGDLKAQRIHRLDNRKNPPSGWSLLFAAMKKNRAFNGLIARAGEKFGRFEKESPRTMASILQVADTNTAFLDSPGIGRCVSKSTFGLPELKTASAGATLFLCLPERYRETHFRWLRMMTTLIIGEMERVRSRPASGHPVLMVLDEFPSLRRMRVLENAAAQIAGFGVKMVFVTQTLPQLKELYGDNWETLLANASAKLFFSNGDNFTRDYVSKLVGEIEVSRFSRSASDTNGSSYSSSHSKTHGQSSGESRSLVSTKDGLQQNITHSIGFSSSTTTSNSWSSSRSRSEGITESIQKRPLLTPDEVGRMFGDRDKPTLLALISGQQPIALRRGLYFREIYFEGKFGPHPDHKPPPRLWQLPDVHLARMLKAGQEEARRRSEAKRRAEEAERERLKAEFSRRCAEHFAAVMNANAEAGWRRERRERLCMAGLRIGLVTCGLALILAVKYWLR
jgi:type IV secretory pathway TraG/TraD family ATPase VirD4